MFVQNQAAVKLGGETNGLGSVSSLFNRNNLKFPSAEVYKFSLFFKNTITTRDEAFRVRMMKNQTLLEAMPEFNCHKFW